MQQQTVVQPVLPLTYSRDQLAQVLGISTAALDRLNASGKIGPRPAKLGCRKLWLRSEVDEWMHLRDPAGNWFNREQWQAMKKAKG